MHNIRLNIKLNRIPTSVKPLYESSAFQINVSEERISDQYKQCSISARSHTFTGCVIPVNVISLSISSLDFFSKSMKKILFVFINHKENWEQRVKLKETAYMCL